MSGTSEKKKTKQNKKNNLKLQIDERSEDFDIGAPVN